MSERTRQLWTTQLELVGDRTALFGCVAEEIGVGGSVLYPGSYVDLTPSQFWRDVTYVDLDRRAARFFGDVTGVLELIAELGGPSDPMFRFLHQDYREPLAIEHGSIDLLISLYAGFVSMECGHLLRPGGHLLVNSSHGDAALASLDSRFELVGAVTSRPGTASLRTDDLGRYLVPARGRPVDREEILSSGRGVRYTTPAFAYLFRRRTTNLRTP